MMKSKQRAEESTASSGTVMTATSRCERPLTFGAVIVFVYPAQLVTDGIWSSGFVDRQNYHPKPPSVRKASIGCLVWCDEEKVLNYCLREHM
jgi:hypothetical protein